jgi:hypothetical protein
LRHLRCAVSLGDCIGQLRQLVSADHSILTGPDQFWPNLIGDSADLMWLPIQQRCGLPCGEYVTHKKILLNRSDVCVN